jgi:glycosyltransferase involved in cell wall biosynthesis
MGRTLCTIPLVAIVTPVYNGAKYLAETMDCVQLLDYPNLIHIVLDNASIDTTPEIISSYCNGRVPILTARNKVTIPMINNFNAALKMVPPEASYLRILCADDAMASNAISRQVEVAERDPKIGIVGCECREPRARRDGLPKKWEIFNGREIVRGYLRREHSVLDGTQVLIRLSNHHEQPFYYDPVFRGAADTDANLRICMNGKFGFVHDALAMCRQHELNHYTIFSRSYFHMPEWLMLFDRYGRFVLDEQEYRARRSTYRRHYLRRLLLLRWRDGNKTTFDEHMALLRQNNDPAGWLDFAGALAEWTFRGFTRCRSLAELTTRRAVSR